MNINIYDVSKKAGVSIATVSRVLNGNTRVSEKTRDKVINAMKELDYTPNVFARGLGLNTMKTIGIIKWESGRTLFTILNRSFANTTTTLFFAALVKIIIIRRIISSFF